MKGLYIVTSGILKSVNTLKFGMSEILEGRIYDYRQVFLDANYKYCYILNNKYLKKEILFIEKNILEKTKSNYSDGFTSEYRIYKNFEEYHKIITDYLIQNKIDFKILENPVFKKPEDYKSERIDRTDELSKITTKIILREDQKEILTNFELDLDKNIKSGIIMKPTGTGKFIDAIGCIGKFIDKFHLLKILFMTERKDILLSHFFDENKINLCKNSELIPKNFKYTFSIDHIDCDMLVINNASLILNKKYRNFDTSVFGLVIVDECHWLGALDRFKFINYIQKNWINLKYILGLSATPIRDDKEHIERINKIFNGNFIYKMYIPEAIKKDIIVKPLYEWIETEIVSGEDIEITKHGMKKVLRKLNILVKKSVTKKGICWTSSIHNAEKWFDLLRTFKNELDELCKFKIFITYSNCTNDGLKKFLQNHKYNLLIAVGRCIEGYDDKEIDFCGNLDYVKDRTIIKTIQQSGRCLRKFENKEYGIIFDGICFDEKEDKIIKISDDIIKYIVFIENLEFNENKREIIEKIKRKIKIHKSNVEYKGMTFNLLGLKSVTYDSLEKIINEKLKSQLLLKSELKKEYKEMKIYIEKFKITDKFGYRKLCEMHDELIKNPELYFKSIWKNWYDFLGIDTSIFIQSKEEWKLKCVELNITTYKNYRLKCKSHRNLPLMPDEFYKEFTDFENELLKEKEEDYF